MKERVSHFGGDPLLFRFERTNKGGLTMAGTKAGGKAAAATNKAKYGSDFYAKIGAKGGKLGKTGGFFANRELARAAGAKGGRISRRTKKTV
jgi:general stress protein YciG